MSPKIVLKHSATASKVPLPTDLAPGEVAINSADVKAYIKDSNGNVVQLAGTGSASVGVGETPPLDPSDGDLWWDSSTDSGQLYVYYTDADSSQWVEASPSAGAGDDKYVQIDGDNMTGSLTLGTDKITLNATDGSIAADGQIISNNLIRGVYFASSRGTAKEGCFQSELNGIPTSYIYADGSAYLSSGKIQLNSDGSITAAGDVKIGGLSSAPNITLASDGSITAAGGKSVLYSNGSIVGAAGKFNVFDNGEVRVNTDKVILSPDGSITAAGDLSLGDPSSVGTGDGSLLRSDGRLYLYSVDANPNVPFIEAYSGASPKDVKFTLTKDGSASFDGQVTATGGIEFGDGTIQLTAASGSGGGDLQSVTDAGNTTTNGATFGGNTKVGTFDVSSDTATGFLFVPQGLQYVQRPASSPNEAVYSAYKGQNKTINFTCEGDAELDGNIQVGGNAASGSAEGSQLRADGQLFLTRPAGNTTFGPVFSGFSTGNSTPTSVIASDGSAEFAGPVTFNGEYNKYTGYGFYEPIANNAALYLYGTNTSSPSALRILPSSTSGAPVNIELNFDGSAEFAGNCIVSANSSINSSKVLLNADGSGSFQTFVPAGGTVLTLGDYQNLSPTNYFLKGRGYAFGSLADTFSVTTDGTVSAANVTFNLEANDDTKYTATTNEDGEQTLVYNGAVLDVKERIQNVLARMDAIEANEITDDATDSALLALVASLSSRIDERDAQIAALTARLDTAGL